MFICGKSALFQSISPILSTQSVPLLLLFTIARGFATRLILLAVAHSVRFYLLSLARSTRSLDATRKLVAVGLGLLQPITCAWSLYASGKCDIFRKMKNEKERKMEKNIAFIDGQNLHLGIRDLNWKLNHNKFRTYLKERYKVCEANYFPGFFMEDFQDLYKKLQEAGFLLTFKKHTELHQSKKKGNVDTLMVFEVMKTLNERSDEFDSIILVTGDGDFYELVSYLIKKKRLKKILFPSGKQSSSLYNKLDNKYKHSLNNSKEKIELK
ncbi:MAG: NYN domain-containing protein [Candidatus Campbellbacteria bacterium]|nr:NYN domain-containing protein [Candidatus Campbellbacteria bacterium]